MKVIVTSGHKRALRYDQGNPWQNLQELMKSSRAHLNSKALSQHRKFLAKVMNTVSVLFLGLFISNGQLRRLV